VPPTPVDLTTSADVSLAACPAAPVTPASSPTLPATGPDVAGPALLAGLLLGGSGAALLALSLRRRRAAAVRR
jgi:hypothetical protein